MLVHVLDKEPCHGRVVPGFPWLPGLPLGHCRSKWRRQTETEPQSTGIEDDVELATGCGRWTLDWLTALTPKK